MESDDTGISELFIHNFESLDYELVGISVKQRVWIDDKGFEGCLPQILGIWYITKTTPNLGR